MLEKQVFLRCVSKGQWSYITSSANLGFRHLVRKGDYSGRWASCMQRSVFWENMTSHLDTCTKCTMTMQCSAVQCSQSLKLTVVNLNFSPAASDTLIINFLNKYLLRDLVTQLICGPTVTCRSSLGNYLLKCIIIGSVHNRLDMVFWLQHHIISWSTPYLKPSTQMSLHPCLVCGGICPISHTGVRISWCLQSLGREDYWFHHGELVFNKMPADPNGLQSKNRKRIPFNIYNKKYLHGCPGKNYLNFWISIPGKKTQKHHPKKPSLNDVDLFVHARKIQKRNLLCVKKSGCADWPLQIKLFVLKSVLSHCWKERMRNRTKEQRNKVHNFIEIKVSTGIGPHLLLDCSGLHGRSKESNGRSKTCYRYK